MKIPSDKHQEFVFGRLLDEVYLLLDFISTRDNRRLDCLNGCIEIAAGTAKRAGSKQEILERITELRFPPPQSGPPTAADAAFLMAVKDKLATEARPANGLTVAFTEMVLIGNALAGRNPEASGRESRLTTRRNLAQAAYPELSVYARMTRIAWMVSLGLLLLLTLVTAMITMGVENGRSALTRLATANATYARAAAAVVGAEQQESRLASLTGPSSGARITPSLDPPYLLQFCDRAKYLRYLRKAKLAEDAAGAVPLDFPLFEARGQVRLCPEVWDAEREIDAARRRIQALMEQRWWFLSAFAPSTAVPPAAAAGAERPPSSAVAATTAQATGGAPAAEGSDGAPARASAVGEEVDTARDNEWRADDAIRLLSQHVLPLCFTVLGAGVSILRDSSRRMHESCLAPRDLPMALSRLALGVAGGLAVGLFYSTPDNPALQLGGITPPGMQGTAVGAQAMAFLAGYGLDALFAFFDSQIRRLKGNDAPAEAASRPAPSGQAA
ncbi:hypothetical protein E0493_20295 [Roseomonas sp. M0104]|uniref:Uncharacterized protein n=1 Tax=Teichococcus coralli TaxID=2545983 RepID=A0A845BI02_9PROT|nr:hypothetical protein [Pseudoroseomonas coralli]MXP65694.1 hypothetical protein [Pseudoroseomonas coralli]